MTADNLRAATEFIARGNYDITIALAQFDPEEDGPTFRRLNISDTVADGLKLLSQRATHPIVGQQQRGDLRVREYDHGYEPQRHEIDYIVTNNDPVGQLVEVPRPAHIPLVGDGDIDDFVNSVRFNVLVLSRGPNRAVLFRRYGPNKELTRSNKLVTLFMGDRLESIEEPTFQFDPNFDLLLFRDHLYIRNRNNFEYILRYYEQLAATARESLDAISKNVPIANFEEFSNACEGNLQKLKKLRNIAKKPYINRITMDNIRRTIDTFGLPVEIDENNELVFDMNDHWGILQLLDDAYLDSGMTGLRYETNSKREV